MIGQQISGRGTTFAVLLVLAQQAFEAMHLPMVSPLRFSRSPLLKNQSLTTPGNSNGMSLQTNVFLPLT